MKKGFTLVELLIVVVILVTLMSMVFRIGNISSDSERRAVTIQRVQRLENALSGYYAAFGMYPPVKEHAKRNIFLEVDGQGRQGDQETSTISWPQVRAACLAQPIGCEFPFPQGMSEAIAASSAGIPSEEGVSFDDGVSQNIGRYSAHMNDSDWSDIKLFKFGALSYLLPRYLVMMNGDKTFFENYAQWTDNNDLPSDALSGQPMTWQQIRNYSGQSEGGSEPTRKDFLRVANIPSQAVCARWMSNFENSLYTTCSREIFGINVKSGDTYEFVSEGSKVAIPYWHSDGLLIGKNNIYYPDNKHNGSTANGYILDFITMVDGWMNELYYYSPPPYQTYTVWSAGADGRTFPPWVSREKLSAADNNTISEWIKDDIIGQRN